MKKPRLLVVGSFMMDLTFQSERFVQAGETIMGNSFQAASGGKGANQAVQAARLGAEVTMVGKVGDDAYGKAMISSLREAGVHTEHITVTDAYASGVSNIQVQSGIDGAQNRIVIVPGANMAITQDDIRFLEDEIVSYDMVILQQEIPMEINTAVARLAHAKGVPVLLNPAPSAPISEEMLCMLDYIAPNEHETKDLTGIYPKDDAAMRAAAAALLGYGVNNVILTLGEAGSVWTNEKEFFLCPAVLCAHPADPTAAGDSFIGAFSTALCAGMTAKAAMHFANQTASITVSRMGAQPSLPTLAEVNAALEEAGYQKLCFEPSKEEC